MRKIVFSCKYLHRKFHFILFVSEAIELIWTQFHAVSRIVNFAQIFIQTSRQKNYNKTLLVFLINKENHEGLIVKLQPYQFNRFRNEKNEVEFSMEILKAGHNFPHCLYLKT